jgi:hypothetical protein
MSSTTTQSERQREARARELGIPADQLPRRSSNKGRKRALKRQQIEQLQAAVRIVDENIQNLAAATRRLNALLSVALPWADELLLPPPRLPGPRRSRPDD